MFLATAIHGLAFFDVQTFLGVAALAALLFDLVTVTR